MADESQAVRGLREVLAYEILALIEKGEIVNYDNALIKGDLDIRKINLPKYGEGVLIASQIIITNSRIEGKLNLKNATLEKQAIFKNTQFSRYACFWGVNFECGATFEGAIFIGGVAFKDAQFSPSCSFINTWFLAGSSFWKAQFHCDISFHQALFKFWANFIEAKFNGESHFWGTQFRDGVSFDNAEFNKSTYFWKGAYFGDFAQFYGAQFNGDVLTFKTAIFDRPISQEGACRRAKNVLERNGDREEAGYHFYREMEAKRKQKGIDYEYFDYESLLFCSSGEKYFDNNLTSISRYIKYNLLEYLFIQIIFGYGVHPFRLWVCWFAFVFAFALIYFIGNGVTGATQIWDYIWFSITVAVTPGFAGYKPATGLFQVVAGLEAILGTFMWAAFIATFARKYMR